MSNLEKCSFIWKVESFSMLPYKKGEYFMSPYFTTQIFDGTDFCLWLFPRGDRNSFENYLACYLSRKNPDAVPIEVGFSFTLLSKDGLDDDDKVMASTSFEIVNTYGFGDFVERDFLHRNKDRYLPKDVLTIKCLVWSPTNKVITSKLRPNIEMESCSQISSITRIKVNKKCIIWPIKTVEELRLSKGKTSFHVKSALENIPSLELVFSLGDDSNEEHAQIDVTECSIRSSISNLKSIFVKCKMTVMSVHKEYQHSQEDTFSFELDAPQTWHFPNFIEINNLKTDKYVHADGTLYIMCEFFFSSKGYAMFQEERPALSPVFQMPHVPRTSHLSNNIHKLYGNATFCDVELRVKDFTYPAHKVVLCAQSPVFHAMFTTDMEEKSTNVVVIDDFDGHIIRMMLEFIHSDVVENAENLEIADICDLYSAADFYQILHLKQYCSRLLLSTMVHCGPCHVLSLADRYQDHFMMSCALQFIQAGGIEYFQSEQWKDFFNENPSLCGKVMIEVMKKM